MSELIALNQRKEELEIALDIAEKRARLQELQQQADEGRYLQEALGDVVDRREWLRDDPTFNVGNSLIYPPSAVSDREDGKFRPIYETEQELQMIRGPIRLVCSTFGSAINILTNLNSYTIGEGFTHEVRPKTAECPPQLIEAVQNVINQFHEDNDWTSDLETESHEKAREDGEAPLKLTPSEGWRVKAELIEPDQITEPRGMERDLENWIGCDEAFSSSWSFGVHTRRSRPGSPLGYHVINDSSGLDWEYLTAGDVDTALRLRTGCLELIKRNVPRNVKRGISDFYPIVPRLRNVEKLGSNLEVASAIQAAIAFIREHNPNSTPDQIAAIRSAAATARITRQTELGPKTVNQQTFNAGSIVDTNGSKYLYGPAGQSSAPDFVQTIQAGLRYVGSRWVMPEYMISGDASNNNFASILVAGSPFVRAIQGDQRKFAGRYKRVDWTVVRFAYAAGYFSRYGIQWDKLVELIEIYVTPTDITIADDLKDAQKKEIERRNKVLSRKTWIKESGRNTEEELANLAEEGPEDQPDGMGGPGQGPPQLGPDGRPMPGQQMGQQQQPGGEFRDANRLEWKRYIANIQDVLAKVAQKQMTPSVAAESLGTMGVDPERIQRLLADVMDDGRLTPENAKDIAEEAAIQAVGMMILEDVHDPRSHLYPPNRTLFSNEQDWRQALDVWMHQILPLTSPQARAERFRLQKPITPPRNLAENCGDGEGGFQPGNTCGGGGDGDSGGSSTGFASYGGDSGFAKYGADAKAGAKESGGSRRTKIAAEMEKEASRIRFSDSSEPYDRDESESPREIRDRLSDDDRDAMTEYVDAAREEYVSDRESSYEPDIDKGVVARDAGYSLDSIAEKVDPLIRHDDAMRAAAAAWWDDTDESETNGVEAIDSLIAKIKEFNPEIHSNIEKELTTYRDEAKEAIDKAVQAAEDEDRDSAREGFENDFNPNPAERDFLREWAQKNPSAKPADESEHGKSWFKFEDGMSFPFKLKDGREFRIRAYTAQYGGLQKAELQFADDSGNFDVTGRGDAMEVFRKVVPAITAFVKHEDPDVVSFSASSHSYHRDGGEPKPRLVTTGPSRQKLYDRLVSTMLDADPNRFAKKMDTGRDKSTRYYVVGKNELRDKIEKGFDDVHAGEHSDPQQEIKPHSVRESWQEFTLAYDPAWLVESESWESTAILENCGDGSGGFQPGNDCAKGDGGGGSGGVSSAAGGKVADAGSIISRPKSQEFFDRVKKDGGFTYDPIHDSVPKSGFVVSTYLPEERIIKDSEFGAEHIQEYTNQHAHILKTDPQAMLGVWHDVDNGNVVLDIVRTVQNREEAETLGHAHKQDSIFDIGTGSVITLDKGAAARRAADVDPARNAGGQSGGADKGADGREQGAEKVGAPAGGIAHPRDIHDLERFISEVQASDLYKQVQTRMEKFANEAPGGRAEDWSKSKFTDSAGAYTPERAAIHETIVKQLLNPKAAAAPGKRPVALITLGPPGAGKTSVVGGEAKRLGLEFTTINSDDVKGMLPGYEGWNGGLYHTESNDIAMGKLAERAIGLRHNIVYDSTGSSVEKMERVIAAYSKAGYDVHLMNVALPSYKSAGRAWDRFAANAFNKTPGKEPGRYVPMDFVKYVNGRPGRTYQSLKSNPDVKAWVTVSTDVPMGAKPIELERS